MFGRVSDNESHFLTISYNSTIYKNMKKTKTMLLRAIDTHATPYLPSTLAALRRALLLSDLRQFLEHGRQSAFDVVDLDVVEQLHARTEHGHSTLKQRRL